MAVIKGTTGNDRLFGTYGVSDILYGLAGDDELRGHRTASENLSSDIMYGGAGNDVYHVTSPYDRVIEYPGEGIDWVDFGMDPTLPGYIKGYTYVLPANVENLTFEDVWHESYTSRYYFDLPFNGKGNGLNNRMEGNRSNNIFYGYSGNDHLLGWWGNDTMYGGNGDDYFDGDLSSDGLNPLYGTVSGEDNPNFYTYDPYDASVKTQNYFSRFTARAGNDTMYGGTGNDYYFLNGVGDRVIEYAGQGYDRVYAGFSYILPANVEYLYLEGTGNLSGTGNNLNNYMIGNAGNNFLNGGAGNDTLLGMGGNDTLWGGAGNDTLSGGTGADVLAGGAGNDILKGGAGNDILTGGTGLDTFVFESLRDGIDTITDFVSGQDRLQLAQAELSALLTEMRNSGGSLAATRFVANDTGVATNANQRIIYNLKTGALYYDADGTGSGVATQFATLGNKPANLKAGDFFAAAS